MKSEKINQFKWLFIDENKIEIRTVKYDNVDEVEEMTYEKRFEMPQNINLWKPLGQEVIVIEREK